MEPEAKYTLVGAAVVILVAVFAALLVWLHSTGEESGARRYKIYFEHQSLQGIQPRGDVTMRGVKVGTITSFRFSRQRPAAVEVFIAVDPSTPVRESTRATVERNFLTGLAILQLVNKTEDSPLLARPPAGEPWPVIAEGEAPMEHLAQSLENLAAHADETMQTLNATLSAQNRAAFADILDNLRRVSRHADQTLAKADQALVSFGQTSGEVRGDMRALTARYDALGAEATVTIGEAREALRKVGEGVDRLSRTADQALSTAGDQWRDTARSLQSAGDSVGTAAGRLRNPQQAMFGPAEDALGPGESRR
jgi:phospholipid/cholesterol/gamma-HCH transport system substrate-binding protein